MQECVWDYLEVTSYVGHLLPGMLPSALHCGLNGPADGIVARTLRWVSDGGAVRSAVSHVKTFTSAPLKQMAPMRL